MARHMPAPPPIRLDAPTWDSTSAVSAFVFDAVVSVGSPPKIFSIHDASVENRNSGGTPFAGPGVTIQLSAGQRIGAGRFYFEVTFNNVSASDGGLAIAPYGVKYQDLAINGTHNGIGGYGGMLLSVNGNVIVNGVGPAQASPDPWPKLVGLSVGDVVGVALDLIDGFVWFKVVSGPDAGATPDWNGGAAGIGAGSSPETRTLGVAIPFAGALDLFVPYMIFGGEANQGDMIATINFGQVPYKAGVFTIPSLYGNWPSPTATALP